MFAKWFKRVLVGAVSLIATTGVYLFVPPATNAIDNFSLPVISAKAAPADPGASSSTDSIESEAPVVPAAKSDVKVGHGEYMNIAWNAYLEPDGTYLVPVADLQEMSGSYSVVLFEGEFASEVGVHQICTLFVEDRGQCPVEGASLHLQNQGSFWDYEVISTRARGDNLDDLRMAFAHDKWKNWDTQGIDGNPIAVLLSTGEKFFEAGVEPLLDVGQQEMVRRNAEQRCSELTEPLEETPLSDASDESGMVVGAPGSYSCRTLFVGQLTGEGDMVARWWTGAKDGFAYFADGAHFYLVPTPWGASEVTEWVSAEFGVETLELLADV